MPYIGTSPSNGVRRVHTYTATASQTTFTGASSEGVTLSYADTNYLDVFQNGVLLGSADYTSTSGTSVVLAQGASADDLIVIVVYDVFSVADTVSKTNGGTFDNGITIDEDGATVLTVDRATSDGTIIDLQKDGTSVGTIGSRAGVALNIVLDPRTDGCGLTGVGQVIRPTDESGTNEDNTIDLGSSSHRFKDIYLSSGVRLGGTGTANLLDDYEEGTWTPSLNAYAGTPTISDALYTKIGRYVFATCRVALDGTSDASTFQILGLPFTSFASSAAIFGANVIYANSSTAPTYGLIGASGTTATFYSSSGSNLSYNGAGNDKSFRINLHYFST